MKKILLSLSCCALMWGVWGCDKKTETPASSSEEIQISALETSETKKETEIVEEIQARYYIDPETYLVKPIDSADPNVVLLTVDDAPRPSPQTHALKIAEHFKDAGVHGIFFINGMYLDTEEGKSALQTLADEGHVIGNHTETHANLSNLSKVQTEQEINTTNQKIERLIHQKPVFFRPPFGSTNANVKDILQAEHMIAMNWTYGYDWFDEYTDPKALANIMINSEFLQPGANLLMHDTRWTAEAMPAIIQGLKDKGYTILDPREIDITPR